MEVDVTRNELEEQLRDHLKHLIYPLNTVLDESIGSAFWFAARGQGYRDDGQSYTSPARVSKFFNRLLFRLNFLYLYRLKI